MRLTLALLKRKMPPGNIKLGKHRLAHHVYPQVIENMVKRLQIEERNMLLLRHPYLTKEQEFGHEKALGKDWESVNTEINRKLKASLYKQKLGRSRSIEETFNTLLVGEKWDV